MSAEIITLQRAANDDEPDNGNGAIEAVRNYFDGMGARPGADHFLAWLWQRGFMVIPVPDEDPAA